MCWCPAYVADADGRCTEARECALEAPPPVLSKPQNYGQWVGGAYGNRLRAWRSFAAYMASGFPGLVSLRYLGVGGGPYAYDLTFAEAVHLQFMWRVSGWVDGLIMVNESAPDQSIVLQGEYLNDVYHDGERARWGAFTYSRAKVKMRAALAAGAEHADGLQAQLLLQGVMTASSWADWQVLLERYPGHVLEVSVYSGCLGDVPGRNALVWEVRRY
jgi:hypothetical protein